MDAVKRIVAGWSLMERVTYPATVVSLCLVLWSSLYRDFDHDEFEALHAAWLVFSGQTVYVDFFQHHHFLLYYLLAPLFNVFGEGIGVIIAARIVSLGLLLGIVWVSYKIARLLFTREAALATVFLLSTTYMFIDKAIEIRPDVPFVFAALVSVWLLLRYRVSRNLWQLGASAAALFVAFLFLQKAVFFGMVIGIVFLYETYRRRFGWTEYLIFGGTFAVLLGGFIWYVSAVFGWTEYFFLNWKLNTQLLNGFPFYKYLLRSMVQSPLFWGVFIAALIEMIRRRTGGIAVLFAVGLLGSVVLVKSPFPQYYLMSLPFVAIVGAPLLARLALRWPRSIALLMVVSVLWSIGVAAYLWQGNERQLAKVAYVLSVTGPDDLVYDGDAQFNIFRRDMDYFWFSVKPKTGNLTAYRLMREYPYDPYQLISEKQPKVVSDSFIRTKESVIAEHYTRSSVFKDLYIRNQE